MMTDGFFEIFNETLRILKEKTSCFSAQIDRLIDLQLRTLHNGKWLGGPQPKPSKPWTYGKFARFVAVVLVYTLALVCNV